MGKATCQTLRVCCLPHPSFCRCDGAWKGGHISTVVLCVPFFHPMQHQCTWCLCHMSFVPCAVGGSITRSRRNWKGGRRTRNQEVVARSFPARFSFKMYVSDFGIGRSSLTATASLSFLSGYDFPFFFIRIRQFASYSIMSDFCMASIIFNRFTLNHLPELSTFSSFP